MRRCERPRRGFTMVELMLVVIIVGLMVALAVPRFPVTASRSDANVRNVRGLLQLAQRSAVTRQSSVIVGVDVTNARFRIHEDADNDRVVDQGERVRSEPMQEGVRLATPSFGGVQGAVSGAVVGSNLRTLEGLPSVIFRRDGSASSDVELYFATVAGAADGWRAIQVSPATGRVDAWRASGTTWRRMQP